MKQLIFALILLISCLISTAQNKKQETRKQIRAKKEALQKDLVKQAIDNKSFVFNATHVLPMGGASRYLNYDYDVEIRNDSIHSYLPFFGVAYRIEYGSHEGGFQFDQPIKKYKSSRDKKGYKIKIETKNKNDVLVYNFAIFETGSATLSVTSTNRQSITYLGTIEKYENKE